jgi:hypothetical protein
MRVPAQKLPQYGTGAATTVTPRYIGDIYVKTDDSSVYVAKGLEASTDWIQVSN